MIVDCHTHINSTANENDVSEHLAASEIVDACIVLANSDGLSEDINRNLAGYVNKHKARLIGFAVVMPTNDKIDVKSLTYITEELELKGFVIYCSACGFHPAHSRAMQFYQSAQELGLPVFFHNSSYSLRHEAVLSYAQPYLLDEVAREFSELKIVIGNMGVPFVDQTLSMIAKHENVYADLTIRPTNVWQTYNVVVAAHERGVMDKLLFGSGYPLANAQQCMETLLGFNMLLADTNLPTVPRGSIRNIIGRNTLDVLGIEHEQIEPREHKDTFAFKEKATNSHG